MVSSYPISKLRRRIWGEASQEKSARFYKWIKRIFVTLITISVIAQASISYDKYLVNTVYWKAKLGTVSNDDVNDEPYSKALMTATYRGDIDVVKLLFRDNYSRQDQLLETAVNNQNYELVNFFLANEVKVTSQTLRNSVDNILKRNLCEQPEDRNYKILDSLLKNMNAIDSELVREVSISLCKPLMEALLKAGGNSNYITSEGQSLLDWVKKIQVTPSNAYNGWLYGKSQGEIEKHRKQMIDLILDYQKKGGGNAN